MGEGNSPPKSSNIVVGQCTNPHEPFGNFSSYPEHQLTTRMDGPSF